MSKPQLLCKKTATLYWVKDILMIYMTKKTNETTVHLFNNALTSDINPAQDKFSGLATQTF